MRSANHSGTSPPSEDEGFPQRGSVLSGAYRLDTVLGEGPSGVVYNSWHLSEHRAYAVKVLHPDLGALTAALVRLRHDNQAIEQLHHPSLSTAALLMGAESPILARPLCPGETLRRRIKDGPLLLPEIARLFFVLCAALEAAGRHGVVHGDLKPENILLAQVLGRAALPVPQIVDFGMCHLRDREGGIGSHPLLGPIGYLSPEQVQGDGAALDGRADVFALGALLYECLTGRGAFEGAQPAITVAKICLGERPRPTAYDPGLPGALDELIQLACHRLPEERLPSPRALWIALHAVIGEQQGVKGALRDVIAAADPEQSDSAPGPLLDREAGGEAGGETGGDDRGAFAASTVSLWPRPRSRPQRSSGAHAIQIFKELETARAASRPSAGSSQLRRSTAEEALQKIAGERYLDEEEVPTPAAPIDVKEEAVTARLQGSAALRPPKTPDATPRGEEGEERPRAPREKTDSGGLGVLMARRPRPSEEPLPPVLGLVSQEAVVTEEAAPAGAPPVAAPLAPPEPLWLRPLPALFVALVLLLLLLLVVLS